MSIKTEQKLCLKGTQNDLRRNRSVTLDPCYSECPIIEYIKQVINLPSQLIEIVFELFCSTSFDERINQDEKNTYKKLVKVKKM